jgi:hypothetical protein
MRGGGGGHGSWGGGGGEHGGGGGGGERGGPGGGQGGGPGGGPGGGRMQLPTDMVVELGDSELVVSERGLPVRKLEFGAFKPAGAATPPDAAKPADAPPSGGPPNGSPAAASPAADSAPLLAAHWEGARIVSQFENRRGGKMQETWELSKDGKQLIIKTAVPATDQRPGIEIKRVYDRVEPD